MRIINLILAVLILSGFVLTSCETHREQVLNDNWGRSFQAIKTNQIISPDAGLKDLPVVDMDGIAAEKVLEKYHQSFAEKPPAQITNINISGVGGK
jgi:hypothetical protein